MKKLALDHSNPSPFTNHGDTAEFHACFTLTGKLMTKRNTTPYWVSGDIGGLQVKSSKATVCHGYDLMAHIEQDAADSYGYVINDFSAIYIMTPAEYIKFIKLFGTEDKSRNKLRIIKENVYMVQWLEAQVNGRDYSNGRWWLG